MKNIVLEFIRRGLIACGFGPIVLALLYLILQRAGQIDVLSVNQVCLGIFSISALAFVAGGMNVVYQIERLPLMTAILLHGIVLYVCYLLTYLVNDWLERGLTPLLVFTVIIVVSYFAIWAIIYSVTRHKTAKLNGMLREKQLSAAEN